MLKAIINLINAIADRARPCKHSWELLEKITYSDRLNPNYKWNEYLYRCTKCGESKRISSE